MAVQDTSGIAATARSASFGEAKWDRISRQLTLRGQPVKLAWRLGEALNLLVNARGGVVSKEELQRQIWGEVQMDDSIVPQCIKSLRRAIDPAPGGGSYIETVSRAGYRLAFEVVDEIETLPAPPPAAPRRGGYVWWLAAALAVLTCAGVAATFYSRNADKRDRAATLVERGYRLLRGGNRPDGSRATLLFREALEIIPNFPGANAGLAEAAARLGEMDFEPALALARRAVDSDTECSECQSTLGYVLGVRMWKWSEAGQHLRRSVELAPNRASHHILYAEWLMVNNRLDEAAREALAASRLEPGEPRAWSILAAVRYFQQRYHDSIRESDRAANLDFYHPSAFVWAYRSNMQLGDDANAVVARVKEINAVDKDGDTMLSRLLPKYFALLEARGRKAVVEAWLEDVGKGRPREVHRYNRATWYMWVGEQENALAELEAGVKSRPYQMIYTAVDPAFAPLRPNPRFREVVRKLGLSL